MLMPDTIRTPVLSGQSNLIFDFLEPEKRLTLHAKGFELSFNIFTTNYGSLARLL